MATTVSHRKVLQTSASVLNDRAAQYGDETACFDRIATIASTILGKNLTAYDISIIMVAMKLGRLREARQKVDTYVDAINYVAFAAQFAPAGSYEDGIAEMEDRIAELAEKFAPSRASFDADGIAIEV